MGDIDLQFYLSILMRRLPLVAVAVALPTLGGLGFALLSPPVYQAKALVMVVSPRIPEEMARSTVSETAVGRFHIIERELTTPPSLVALARRFDIHQPDAHMTTLKIADDMRARIEIEQFWLDPNTPAAPAFAISFEAENAEVAADVANQLASSIVSEDSRRRTQSALETLTFFQQNVDRLSESLAAVEARLLAFRNGHLDALPDSLNFRRNQLSGQEERLLLLDREEATLNSRRFNLVLMFESTGQVPGAVRQTPQGDVVAGLEAALLAQQAIYTDDSPSIVALKARIERLQAAAGTADQSDMVSEEGRQQTSEMDLQLADIDDQLAAIVLERERIAQASTVLEASIALTPGNETALNVMERERENIQTQYNAAVGQLAQASTGEQVENDLKGERLVLLEEAPIPQSPVRPKRTVIVLGGLALGLALAAALMVGLELLNRSVRRPLDLNRSLNMEPLMTIPYISTGGEILGRRAVAMLASGIVVAAIPAAFLLSAHYGLSLDALLRGSWAQLGNSTP